LRFFSDNTGTASPEILAALTEANHGLVSAYGNDPWTLRLDDCLSTYFGTSVRAFPVATGTAANSLSLATLTPSYGLIFAHEEAHIANDEAGAPGFFSGGAQLSLLQSPGGKLSRAVLTAALEAHGVSVHTLQPKALALSQATELGTSYRPDELRELCKLAHDHGLKVQMDGARFANSVAFLDCHPGDVTWRAGVDVMTFGATKNGALAAEAVVFFDKSLVGDFELRRKQSGHLLSKSRFVSAQLLAYVESGAWLRNARRTNELAQKIGRAADRLLMHPVEANEIFLALGTERKQTLRQAGFEFYDWGPATTGETRFVVSWDQRDEDVFALCAALEKLL
jgi:threonine aldolase